MHPARQHTRRWHRVRTLLQEQPKRFHRVNYGVQSHELHQHGITITFDKNFKQSVTDFVPVSEKVMWMKFTKIIKEFYEEIEKTNKRTKQDHINTIMGEINTKVGKRCEYIIGD